MKILNKLTIKHLKSNKKRTIVTIIGIILSTALMVGIGLLISTLRDAMVREVELSNGTHHVMIEIDNEKLSLISKNQTVKEYSYISNLGFSEYEGIANEYKPYIHVYGSSLNYLENLVLKDGRLPNNDNELLISEHLIYNGGLKLKVGDKIKLNLGKRVTKDGFELKNNPLTNESLYNEENDSNTWIINEKLIDTKEVEYIIVGICERDKNEDYSNPGYSVFTIDEGSKLDVFVTYKKIKNTFKNTNSIATNLGYEEITEDNFKEVDYNYNLLSINGVTKYDNITTSLSLVICIILSLISIACIIVIYNSFAISVMERKKQFGLFASIGTTRKQLRYTVFYEAFIVGIIGIPLGILSSYIGIGIVIKIINHLLPLSLEYGEFKLVTYPLFIFIPIIFMVLTILVSAYLPAKSASRVSPIEAIRQNDDIKIKSSKVKSPKFINKIFGVEGDIAYKNMKRNKKKYRITIISLFISIVLFISFSSLIKYGLESTIDFTEIPEYEYVINVSPMREYIDQTEEIINKILSLDGIKKYETKRSLLLKTEDLNIKFNKEAIKNGFFKDNEIIEYVSIIEINNEAYQNYKKQIGLKEDRPIVINKYQGIVYNENSRKSISTKLFDNISNFTVYYENDVAHLKKYTFENVYLTDIYPMSINNINYDFINVIVNEDMFKTIYNEPNNENGYFKSIYLVADDYSKIDEIIEESNSTHLNIFSNNIKEELKLVYNIILVIKILLYGFISLVTLIGVTSVLNTINTSIALRRKEFAVLRSIGLTPKGFNKILFFESLFFGLKSLLYGIPVGLLVTLLLHLSIGDMIEFDYFMIPYESILITIIGVFIIVMFSQWYATRKIKKENILNAIREENI